MPTASFCQTGSAVVCWLKPASNPPPGVDIWNLNGGGTYDVSGAKLPQLIISKLPNVPFVPLGP